MAQESESHTRTVTAGGVTHPLPDPFQVLTPEADLLVGLAQGGLLLLAPADAGLDEAVDVAVEDAVGIEDDDIGVRAGSDCPLAREQAARLRQQAVFAPARERTDGAEQHVADVGDLFTVRFAQAQTPDDVVRTETSLVQLNVGVVDPRGRAITTLSKNDFTVYEDGVKQTIQHFEPTYAPFSLALLLDTSGSTSINCGNPLRTCSTSHQISTSHARPEDEDRRKDHANMGARIQNQVAAHDPGDRP